jgi:hypothetical protein
MVRRSVFYVIFAVLVWAVLLPSANATEYTLTSGGAYVPIGPNGSYVFTPTSVLKYGSPSIVMMFGEYKNYSITIWGYYEVGAPLLPAPYALYVWSIDPATGAKTFLYREVIEMIYWESYGVTYLIGFSPPKMPQ